MATNRGPERAVQRAIEEALSTGRPVTVYKCTHENGREAFILELGTSKYGLNYPGMRAAGFSALVRVVTIRSKVPKSKIRGIKATTAILDEAQYLKGNPVWWSVDPVLKRKK